MSDAVQPIANHALSVYPHLNAPGFEASKVFALTALFLAKPPPNFPTPAYLRRHLASLYLFVIHPSDVSSTGKHHPGQSHRLIPETWYLYITNKTIDIGRGKPPTTLLGRRRRAEIVIECTDRDLVDIATGKARATTLYEAKRLRIRGKLDKALEISRVLSHERSKLYRVAANDESSGTTQSDSYNEDMNAYSIGSSMRARL
ncbi:hypothetical protein MBRA1_002705 [Malassezia brasiliensis]|uniref:SCP2 domain-containing protein n=1 Tax=Malassezia brasiliensis TaxID=1821822 RepID=A0AAF0DUN9_9BASI|nr:hypothetical protein MBRA1_002705 [Malassezia brasiliensis]